MKTKSDKPLSVSQEQRLSAFVDGELSSKDAGRVQAKLSAENPALVSELERLKFVGKEFRAFHEEALARDAEVRPPLDIWSQIAPRLEEPMEAPSGLFQRMGAWLQGLSASRVLVSGMAAAIVILVVTQQSAQEGSSNLGSLNQVAEVPRELSGALLQQAKFQQDRLARDKERLLAERERGVRYETSSDDTYLYTVSLGREGSGGSGLGGKNPQEVQIRVPNPYVDNVRGGFRIAGGGEIEWIKSKKQVRLVPSNEPVSPPVIWVGDIN